MKNNNFMMGYVKQYLDGDINRFEFELDFDYLIMKKFKQMCRENREYAELFYDYISEAGVDAGKNLPDDKFKKLIKKQYNEVKDIADNGFS
jgi:hypothetical protein